MESKKLENTVPLKYYRKQNLKLFLLLKDMQGHNVFKECVVLNL